MNPQKVKRVKVGFDIQKIDAIQESPFETTHEKKREVSKALNKINDKWGEWTIYSALMFGRDIFAIIVKNTMHTRYVHLETSFISTGQIVVAGHMGATEEAIGVDLHYELRINQSGNYVTVDPKLYIQ